MILVRYIEPPTPTFTPPLLFSISPPEAYVSLVTNDNYALGALALGQSLRDTTTTRELSLLITDQVSHGMR